MAGVRRVNADIYISTNIWVNLLAVLLVPLAVGAATLLHVRRLAAAAGDVPVDSC
jgi:hypothetical protein